MQIQNGPHRAASTREREAAHVRPGGTGGTCWRLEAVCDLDFGDADISCDDAIALIDEAESMDLPRGFDILRPDSAALAQQ